MSSKIFDLKRKEVLLSLAFIALIFTFTFTFYFSYTVIDDSSIVDKFSDSDYLDRNCFAETGLCTCTDKNRLSCESEDRSQVLPSVLIARDQNTWLPERPKGHFLCPGLRCVIEDSLDFAGFTSKASPPMPSHVDAWLSAAPFYAPNPILLPHQQSIFMSLESCSLYPKYCDASWLSEQNITAVLSPMEVPNFPRQFISYVTFDSTFMLQPPLDIDSKINAVAAFISNCDNTNTGRLKILADLSGAGIEVHSFGKCMHSHDTEVEFPECAKFKRVNPIDDYYKMCIIRHYRFTIAIENHVMPGYTTEKIFHPLAVGSVPIYGGNPTVSEILPEANESAIILRDCKPSCVVRPEELTRIKTLMADDEAYNRALQWKVKPINSLALGFQRQLMYSLGNVACSTCQIVARSRPAWPEYPDGEGFVRADIKALSCTLFVVNMRYDAETQSMTFLLFLDPYRTNSNSADRVQLAPSQGLLSNFTSVKVVMDGSQSQEVQCTISSFLEEAINSLRCPMLALPLTGTATPINSKLRFRITTTSTSKPVLLNVPVVPSLSNIRVHDVAVCSAAYHLTSVSIEQLVEFVEHHMLLGASLIVLYLRDSHFTARLRSMFGPDEIELVVWSPSSLDSNYVKKNNRYGKILTMNHCMFRLRHRARWVAFADVNEFLWLERGLGIMNIVYPNVTCLSLESVVFVSEQNITMGISNLATHLYAWKTNRVHFSNVICSAVTKFVGDGKGTKVPLKDGMFRHYVYVEHAKSYSKDLQQKIYQPFSDDHQFELNQRVRSRLVRLA